MTAAGDGPSVIVSGTIAGTPHQGGATWAVLQYLLGLRKLACDVHFVEELDRLEDRAVRYCAEVMKRFGLERRWALVPRDGGEPAGMSQQAMRATARNADVLFNVSGMLQDPDVLEHVPIRVYVDLDPAFVQLWHAVEGVNMHLDGHTHFVSVADGIGRLDCPIPTCGREWLSTLPPVVLSHWPVADLPAPQAATTVGHWRSYGSIEHNGIKYGQKAHAMRQLIDLPRHTDVKFVLAFAIHPNEVHDLEALEKNGWTLLDPAAVVSTPEAYRRFVQGSWAELGVVKSGYVVSRSGWFSDRSACYLASGRPVIAQDTGFGRRLPTGDGLFAFSSVEEVVAAIAELTRDYETHRRAARAVAEEHLASDHILRSLLEQVCQ